MVDESDWRRSRMASRDAYGEAIEGAIQRGPLPKAVHRSQRVFTKAISWRANAVVVQRRLSAMASSAVQSAHMKA